jgi:hypothetical protein
MFVYTAYNLCVWSDMQLPELMPTTSAVADVTVRFGSVRIPEGATPVGSRYHVTDTEICFAQEDVGSFLVRDGREIIVEPSPTVEERVLRLFVLGPSMGALLHQRNRLVLHSSSVVIGSSAVAFLGESGYGKSTTAAAFVNRGHALLADDITPVEFGTGLPTISPGFPQVKLHPDSASAVGHAPGTLPRIHPKLEKRALRMPDSFIDGSFPLRCIYVLDRNAQVDIEPLLPQAALVELVRFSYSNRLLRATHTAGQHMQQCAALVNSVPVRRLRNRTSLADLDRLVDTVERDLRECTMHHREQPVLAAA